MGDAARRDARHDVITCSINVCCAARPCTAACCARILLSVLRTLLHGAFYGCSQEVSSHDVERVRDRILRRAAGASAADVRARLERALLSQALQSSSLVAAKKGAAIASAPAVGVRPRRRKRRHCKRRAASAKLRGADRRRLRASRESRAVSFLRLRDSASALSVA